MQHGSDLGCQDLLDLVDLRAAQSGQSSDFVHGQGRVQLEKADDIAILGIAPILPEVIGRQHVRIEPHRAIGALAHLGARGGRQERRRHGIKLWRPEPMAEFDAIDDIAPLIRAAQLQAYAVTPVEFDEIIGLQDHIVEFEEGQRLFAFQPQLDGIE